MLLSGYRFVRQPGYRVVRQPLVKLLQGRFQRWDLVMYVEYKGVTIVVIQRLLQPCQRLEQSPSLLKISQFLLDRESTVLLVVLR